ncbi:MAG: carbon storage regulator CsrA [Blastocatellia bacterium]|nr:carbon storage regulator CsrA [Blastocatellia bacterium]
MLVLKRQAGEKLVIGNEVTIEVLSVSGDRVRLGIVAPRETSVHRYEIFAEIQDANRAASHTATAAPPNALVTLAAHLRSPGEAAATPTAEALPTSKGHAQ